MKSQDNTQISYEDDNAFQDHNQIQTHSNRTSKQKDSIANLT